MKSRELFFRDLARAVESWAKRSADLLTNPSIPLAPIDDAAAIRKVRETLAAHGVDRSTVEAALMPAMEGLAHSFLVILDGGTPMAREERLTVTDSRGRNVGEGLHELFASYLLDARRPHS